MRSIGLITFKLSNIRPVVGELQYMGLNVLPGQFVYLQCRTVQLCYSSFIPGGVGMEPQWNAIFKSFISGDSLSPQA